MGMLAGYRLEGEPPLPPPAAEDDGRCTYAGWWVEQYCCEPVVMEATGRVSDDNEAGIELTEFRCTEAALADGRCSVHLDMGDGPNG